MVSVSAKKVFKQISCLCTFNAAPDRSESKYAEAGINSDAVTGIDAYADVVAS
jgi:hypothetical protein